MSGKLGLKQNPETKLLIDNLFEIMHICRSHFTNVFRILSREGSVEEKINDILSESLPTEYYLKNLRVFSNLLKTPPETIAQIEK